mmetsp:Transcript_11739/g.20458  ORF Transcript_11739/g.20458 Transcript_11739/m.20458 type:complete len:83 (-) Transcript_11739:27-275(-)
MKLQSAAEADGLLAGTFEAARQSFPELEKNHFGHDWKPDVAACLPDAWMHTPLPVTTQTESRIRESAVVIQLESCGKGEFAF